MFRIRIYGIKSRLPLKSIDGRVPCNLLDNESFRQPEPFLLFSKNTIKPFMRAFLILTKNHLMLFLITLSIFWRDHDQHADKVWTHDFSFGRAIVVW